MFFARYDEHTSEEIRASKKLTSYSKIQKFHRQNKPKTRNFQLKKNSVTSQHIYNMVVFWFYRLRKK